MKALVTGGCKGLGYALTKYLLSIGYNVYALYNTSKDNALELSNKYANLTIIKCDIKNETEIMQMAEKIDNIDLLINNAGIAKDNNYFDKTKEEFMEVIETNLVGTFLMIKHLVRRLNDASTIINISSNNTLGNYSELAMDYDASKAGINMLTKDFSLALDNIKVLAYAPGWIDTESIREMNPLYLKSEMAKVNQEKLINPDDLAKFIIDNYKQEKSGSIIEIKEL